MNRRMAALLNMIITGTEPFAFRGVTSVISTSTLIDGYAELSTCPTNCFSTTGKTPAFESVVLFTAQVTFRRIGRDTADDLSLEVFDNLWTSPIPPLFR